MNNNTIVSIPFHGTTITAAQIDGEPQVALRPACESMGLDYSAQYRRLSRTAWATVAMTATVGADGKNRDMVMVDRRTFTMWLATIAATRIKNDDARQMVEAFQAEAADALDAYFNDGGAINPRADEHQLNALMFQARAQMELIQAAQGLIHPDHLEAKARVVLARGLGEHAELDPASRPLYTQDYLKERGIKGKKLAATAGVFGKRVKAAYIEKYGVEPEKYPLNVKNGQTRNVLAYTERDRPLMDGVWATYYGDTDAAVLTLDLA